MNKVITDLFEKKTGINPRTPSGCNWISQDIEARTGEPVSLNTIKRITGVISDGNAGEYRPRRSTLDIIARYLGYKDFDKLCQQVGDYNPSDFTKPEGLIDTSELKEGTELNLRWAPDRELGIRHLGKGLFKVIYSKNSKLQAEDRLLISQIMVGQPLLVKEVIRGESALGYYTAALEYGLTYAEVSEK